MAQAHFTGIPARLAFDRRSPHIGLRMSVRSLVPLFIFFTQIIEIPALIVLGFWFVMQFLEGAASLASAAGTVIAAPFVPLLRLGGKRHGEAAAAA